MIGSVYGLLGRRHFIHEQFPGVASFLGEDDVVVVVFVEIAVDKQRAGRLLTFEAAVWVRAPAASSVTSFQGHRSMKVYRLHADYVDQFFHRRRGLLQRGILVWRQLDLNDLLHATRAKLHRHADEQVPDAVLALQEHGGGRIFFLSLRMASTISAAAAPGAYQALVPTSFVISAPPLAVRGIHGGIKQLCDH